MRRCWRRGCARSASAPMLTREPGGSPGAEIMRYVLLSGAARPLGPQRRGGAVCRRARRSSHHADPARARAGQMGGVRPLRRLHPHLPGRGRQRRFAWRSGRWSASSSATPSPTSPSSSTCRPRRACAAPTSRRGDGGADRFEGEALAFHEKLRDGFLTLAANEPDRCVLIDATTSKEEVAEQIWRVVQKKLDPATAPIQFEDEAV